MGTLASELKSERERRNITLAQIAAETRINLRYLQCLEEGRYNDLPGGMYNRAFLRAYCEVVGLDQDKILRQYEAELSPVVEKPAKSKKILPLQTIVSKRHPLVTWSVMLLLSMSGLFISRKWIASVFSPYFLRAPAADSSTVSLRDTSALTSSAAKEAVDSDSSSPDESESATSTAGQGKDDTTLNPAQPGAPLRLEVEATEKCWISIDSDGRPTVRRLLEPGETRTFGASEQFAIIIGNAGGVRLKINGKLAKPLGKSGDVVKVLINDKNFEELIAQTSN